MTAKSSGRTRFPSGSQAVPGTGGNGWDAVPARGVSPYGGSPTGTSSPPAGSSASKGNGMSTAQPVHGAALAPSAKHPNGSIPGVRAELAAAVRAVNAGFYRLPPAAQRGVDLAFDPLEAKVDAACLSGDRDRAVAAIEAWRDHWLEVFRGAGQ